MDYRTNSYRGRAYASSRKPSSAGPSKKPRRTTKKSNIPFLLAALVSVCVMTFMLIHFNNANQAKKDFDSKLTAEKNNYDSNVALRQSKEDEKTNLENEIEILEEHKIALGK